MEQGNTALDLVYLSRAELAVLQKQNAFNSRVLGVIGFGTPEQDAASEGVTAGIDMPVLAGNGAFEAWLGELPVTREQTGSLQLAYSPSLLFGYLSTDDRDGLSTACRNAYDTVLNACHQKGFPHLLRVWNYFPNINREEAGLERYRSFNVGRHEACHAHGWAEGRKTPAASALGTRSGPLVVYFLAAKQEGEPIENPRQVSAYRYPEQYGPRNPLFSRAMLTDIQRQRVTFISGTASIVGHETRHAGDVKKQTEQTIANLRAIIGQIEGKHPDAGQSGTLKLKAYLRHPDHLQIVAAALQDAFGKQLTVMYLQADICRQDLLVEIEGVYLSPFHSASC